MSEKSLEAWVSWQRCEGAQGAEAFARLANQWPAFFAESTLVSSRWSALPFYRANRLMELHFTREGVTRRIFALYGPRGTRWLNGETSSMHETNDAESLALSELLVADYVRFFFYFLRADDSAFVLIESSEEVGGANDVVGRAEDEAEVLTLEAARANARPLMLAGVDTEGRWLVDATIAYEGGLFSASLAVGPDGAVEMTDDEPIGALDGLLVPEAPALKFELQAPDTADDELAQARLLVGQGRNSEALALLKQALEKKPSDIHESILCVASADDPSELEAALNTFNEATRLDENAGAHWKMALALELRGGREDAVAQYQAAVELAGANLMYLFDLSRALFELGRVDEAVAVADGVSDPVVEAAYRNRCGDWLRGLGRREDAVAQYQAAVGLADASLMYLFDLGDALFELGRVDEAVAVADSVSDPVVEAAYRNHCGRWLRGLGRREDAVAQFQAAVGLAGGSLIYLFDLGGTLFLLDRVDEAVQLADSVSDPVVQAAYRNRLGYRLRALGRKKDALPQHQRALILAPGNSTHLRGLVLTLLHLDCVEEAVRAGLLGVDMRTTPADKAREHHNLGKLLREFGQYEDGLSQHEKAKALAPGSATYLCELGSAYFELDRIGKALDLAEKVSDPDVEATYRHHLGNRLRARGRKADAFSQYQKAAHRAPASVTYLCDLGGALCDLGRVDDALDLADSLSDDVVKAAYRDHLGKLLSELGRWQPGQKGALAQYQEAVSLAPDNAKYLLDLGNALFELHRDDEALASYETALDKDGSRLADYAAALSRAGRNAQATVFFRRALRALRESPTHSRVPIIKQFSQHLLMVENDSEALRLYEEEIENDPFDVDLRIGLSSLYVRLGRYMDALHTLDDADAYSVGQPDFAGRRGSDVARLRGDILFYQLGQTDKAIEAYSLAVDRIDQDRLRAKLDLANALALDGKWQSARESFEQAISTTDEPLARYLWGSALLTAERYDEAIEHFTNCPAVTGSYHYAICRSYLALAYGRQSRYAEARQEWRHASELFHFLVRRYRLALFSSDWDFGRADSHTLISDLYTSVGTISARLGEYADALSEYEFALHYNPYNVHAAAAAVSYYVGGMGDNEAAKSVEGFARAHYFSSRARKLLDEHEKAAPGCPAVIAERISVAQALVALDDYKSAQSILAAGAEHTNDNSLLELGLGVVYAKQQNYQEAASHFRQAVAIDRIDLKARSNLAECLLKLDRRNDALEAYRFVLRITEDHVESLLGLADVYTAMGDAKEDPEDNYKTAIRYYNLALQASKSKHGSKELTDKEESAVRYSRGYAHAMVFDTAPPGPVNTLLLWSAQLDFRRSRKLDEDRDKAKLAEKKVATRLWRNYSEKITNTAGSLWILMLSTGVFVLMQLSFFFGHPKVKDLSAASYIAVTFSALAFVIVSVSLRSLLRLKVGGIELEKKSVEPLGTSALLGITRDDLASPIEVGFTLERGHLPREPAQSVRGPVSGLTEGWKKTGEPTGGTS
jgi:tetratricopeptide (TPR) repeat protein